MFKKYYKEAYDDIKTNRALIPDIFEKAEKQKKPGFRLAVYRFASCAAAVFAICAILYIYPHLDVKNPPSGTERAAESISALPDSGTTTDTNQQDTKSDSEHSDSDSLGYNAAGSNTESKQSKKDSNLSNNAGISNKKDVLSPSSDSDTAHDITAKQSISNNDGESSGRIQSDNTAKSSAAQAQESAKAVSDVSEDIVRTESAAGDGGVAMFSAADSAAANDSSSGANSKMRTVGSSVIWNSQTYFSYLGIDVFESIKLPQDMKNTSQNEFYVQLSDDGIPLSDEGVLTFASSNGKSLTLYTSKSDYSDSFSSSGYKSKTLNGIKIYYADSEGVCNGYMYTGKAGFTFYSLCMSRTEIESMLLSLMK